METTGGAISAVETPGWSHKWPIVQGKKEYKTTAVTEVPLKGLNIYYSPDDVSQMETLPGGEKNTDEIAKQNAQQYTIHDAVVRFTAQPEAIAVLHTKYQSQEAINRLVKDRAVEAYKAVVRNIDPLKINTKREQIGPSTREILQRTLDAETGRENAIRVESVTFLDFNFEKGVETAFENANKERASVQAEQYKREQQSIKVETQRLAGEAEAAKEIEAAKGRAQAIELEGKALRQNPTVLQLELIKAWKAGGAKVPETLVTTPEGGQQVFPMLDIQKDAKKTPQP